ncbi:MAG: hypothetical protein BMS9Abin28_0643 [Anaerolineae bacterium]|nr:MAG: hypothetical protein BMS9Abin28_0643 [Anaerolineae bacterium]
MTEFGRRVKENASLGTDHGHGGLMLLMGGNVVGIPSMAGGLGWSEISFSDRAIWP